MTMPNSNLMSVLQEAREKGFLTDLFLNQEGDFITPAEEVIHPIVIEIIQCPVCYATIYLVASETIRGCWIHQWDL